MDRTHTYVIKFTDCEGSDVICERTFKTWDVRDALINFHFEWGKRIINSPSDEEHDLLVKAMDEMTLDEMVKLFNVISPYYNIVEIQYVTVEYCYP